MMTTVQDMKDSSIKILFKEDQDDLLSPNREAAADGEPKTQNQKPLLNDDITRLSAPSDKSAAANDMIIDGDGGEEIDNNHPTDQPSIEDDPFDGEAPTQGQGGPSNRAKSSQREDMNTTKKREYLPVDVVLYRAAMKGDWKTAKSILDSDPSAVRRKITASEQTALHVAAAAKQVGFVENLVKLMTSSDLTLRSSKGKMAFDYAALSGVVRIAAVMLEKNPDLPNIHPPHQPPPVFMAVVYKRKDMASFLFSKTDFDALQTSQQTGLLLYTIDNDYFDIALDILKKKPELATTRYDYNGKTALHVLAKKPSAIGSSSELSFWKRCINSWFKGIYNNALMKTFAHQLVEILWKVVLHDISNLDDLYEFIETPKSLLHNAARVGNAELLIILSYSCPDLLWRRDVDDKSIFHIAVENRQESVFNLIYELGSFKDNIASYYDKEKNMNILHLAGKLAAPNHLNRVSGAALQMQRELLWFKEVEKIVSSCFDYQWMKCSYIQTELSNIEIRKDQIDQLTPRELFTKEHKLLLKDGEKWMKNTSNSCMVVATLIATVVFAAAFTVPGGNDSNTGTPIFRRKDPFTVFVISDVAALIMSTTSILIFLSILTSRYTEDDFLVSLPTKLLFGLVTLFLSIVCMVVAFSATFFMVYDGAKGKNVPFAITVVAIIPVSCFCALNYKLIVDILLSVFGSKFSFKQRKNRLF